jgi:hypothetical protein
MGKLDQPMEASCSSYTGGPPRAHTAVDPAIDCSVALAPTTQQQGERVRVLPDTRQGTQT